MFCRLLFVLLAIVLSVLRFTDSGYPFGIFKLFLWNCSNIVSFFVFHVISLVQKFQNSMFQLSEVRQVFMVTFFIYRIMKKSVYSIMQILNVLLPQTFSINKKEHYRIPQVLNTFLPLIFSLLSVSF